MWPFTKKKPLYLQKKVYIPFLALVGVTILLVSLEPLLKKKINEELKFSDDLSFNVDDVDIRFFTLSLALQDIKGELARGQEFLNIKELSLRPVWSKLLQGDVMLNLGIDRLRVDYSSRVKTAFMKVKEEQGKTEQGPEGKAQKDSKIRLGKIKIKNSSLNLIDLAQIKPNTAPHFSKINGEITNLTPVEDEPKTTYEVETLVLGSGKFESNGKLAMLKEPVEWNADGQLTEFDMPTLNPFLKNKVPFTFTKGQLDIYSEVQSQKGEISGYAKPFLGNVDVMESKEEFKGPKHWIIELVGAIANLALRSPDQKEVATKLDFTVKRGEFKLDKSKAIKQAMEHSLDDDEKLKKGIEGKH